MIGGNACFQNRGIVPKVLKSWIKVLMVVFVSFYSTKKCIRRVFFVATTPPNREKNLPVITPVFGAQKGKRNGKFCKIIPPVEAFVYGVWTGIFAT